MQQITSVPPEGLAAEEIEKMRKKFGVNYKFSKFVLDESGATVSADVVCEVCGVIVVCVMMCV